MKQISTFSLVIMGSLSSLALFAEPAKLHPTNLRPANSLVVPVGDCSPIRQVRELGAIDLDFNLVSADAGHGAWGDFSYINNQGSSTAVYFTTPHRSGDSHRLIALGQSENMFFNRGFGASVTISLRPEQAIQATQIEIFDESTEALVSSTACRPDYCGLFLNQTVYPGISAVNYSFSESVRGSPGLGQGVDLLRLQSVSGSNRWFRFVMTDRCGDTFVSRIRFT